MTRSRDTAQLTGGGLEAMIPTHSQPSTSKRKAADDGNPLNTNMKKARKETSTKSGAFKRKLVGEEQPGGLVIVRAPSTRPPSSQTNNTQFESNHQVQPPSRPPSVQPPQQHPPNANASKPPSKKFKSDTTPAPRRSGKGKDRELPANSRSEPEVDEDVRQMQDETNSLRQQARTPDHPSESLNPAFQFPPPSWPSRAPHERIHDTSYPIAQQETPQIQKNKIMRGESVHRRRSSVSRGKRASSSFENTGVITQPHTSVADSIFYKHIDVDLPEPQRAQQLLIWCSYRSMNEFTEEHTKVSSSKQGTRSAGKDPPLSPEDVKLLKSVQDDVIRQLAEKKIDTNVYSPIAGDEPPQPLKENEQNVKNKAREKKFNDRIQRLKMEREAWVEVEKFYKSHEAKVLGDIKQQELMSEKAKGKQRATRADLDKWEIDEQDLPEHFCGGNGVGLARSIVKSETGRKGPISERLQELEFTADRLHSVSHSALETTRLAEADLDRRFALLHVSLSSRSQPPLSTLSSATTPLSSYVPSSISRPPPTTDPQDLLRALSRVDAARPQAQVGDAARRAARELQRANDATSGMAERRLTGVPPPTPRKPPGTPRRATTPGHGR